MKKQFCVLGVLIFSSYPLVASNMIFQNQAYSDYSAQNSGKTGIIEMPNARVMDDWRIRTNFNYNNPFIYYGIAISPLPRLEMNFRISQIHGYVGTDDWSGYGDYKDKAIDIKFLLVKEDELCPAIAIGLDDITGTALYASKYIALSKRFGFLDLTGGYAMGRMGGYATHEYVSNSGDTAFNFITNTSLKGSFFAGFEAHLAPDLVFKVEYNPIDYSKDKVNVFNMNLVSEPKSDFNFGVVYNLIDKMNLSANFERGNSFSLGFRMLFPFEKEGLYPHVPDKKWRASQELKETMKEKNETELQEAFAYEVSAEKLSNVDAAVYKNKIWVGLDNPRYNSDAKALGRAVDTIDEIAPKQYDTLYLALKHRNIEHTVLEVDRRTIQSIKYHQGLSESELQDYITIMSDPHIAYEKFSEGSIVHKTEPTGSQTLKFVHRPHLQTFLNAKDNPFVYRFTWLAGYRWFPWDGAMVQHRVRAPITSSMDEIVDKTLEPETLSTRTDILKYQQYDKLQMNDWTLDQIVSLPFQSLGRASIGYFEAAYAGYGLEWYKPLYDGRYGIGLEYQKVYKREVDDFFALKDQAFDAKFINFYAGLFPELGIATSLKIGQFLAGDKGYKLTVSRKYKDFTIGAYLAKTDTSIFTAQENKDYVDKGVFISVPISVVKNQDSQGYLHYGLSAWTRDVAQTVAQPSSLVGTKLHNGFRLQNDIDAFKD